MIPVTSGKLIELDCFTSVNFFGVRVTFHNLCDNDAVLTSIDNTTLPALLPNGFTLVQGLDIRVLANSQIVKELADGTGVQLDFPIPSNTQDQYAVLLWDNELQQWLDVSQLLKDTELPKALSNDAEDELYQLMPTDLTKAFYRTLTTKKTGVFVIVKK